MNTYVREEVEECGTITRDGDMHVTKMRVDMQHTTKHVLVHAHVMFMSMSCSCTCPCACHMHMHMHMCMCMHMCM